MSKISKIANASALLPIQGISYAPTPSDDTPSPPQKYFDSDFTNSDFPLLWGTKNNGRGDVHNLAKNVGVNLLHLYNWSVPPAPGDQPGQYQRSHISFLDECEKENVKVFIPVSNYFLEQLNQGHTQAVTTDVTAMVTEIYNNTTSPHPAAGIWGIGNEYDLATKFTVDDVVSLISILLSVETSLGIPADSLLPITSPVSFAENPFNVSPTPSDPPAILALQKLEQKLKANSATAHVWDKRFIASTNPNNGGSFLKNYIDNSFPQYYPDLPFFFSEMGVPIKNDTPASTEKKQAAFVLSQLQNSYPRNNFMGSCVFQFLDQSAVKTGTEATFGITEYASPSSITTGTIPAGYVPGGGKTYNVDKLTEKDSYQSVQSVFMGTVYAKRTWHNTQIPVTTGTAVTITYQCGLWTADPKDNNGQLYTAAGDSGITVSQPKYPLVGAPMGALVGRVGEHVFLVGAGPTNVPDNLSGTLELCINDDLTGAYGAGLTDNSGSVSVQITTS